jgi:hypothetical protein
MITKSFAGWVSVKKTTCMTRILASINLSRMQDEVCRCEEDAFLSGVLKQSLEGSKKMVVY